MSPIRAPFRALALLSGLLAAAPGAALERLPPGASGFTESPLRAVRGVTVGPIENGLFAGRGYGTDRSRAGLVEATRLGANWISVTPYGRIYDLQPSGVALDFEAPFEENREAVLRMVDQAHAAGLRVMLVPHLWVETGGWRGEIDVGDDAAWQRWARGYRTFLLEWARVARVAEVDLLSVGVELRSWVTTRHAPSFAALVREVRRVYPGPLTYACNWDDADDTVILGEVDVIGINAFYPLHWENGATREQLAAGGKRAAEQARAIAELWDKPVLFTEFGYTSRRDCAIRPWEWPEHLANVEPDEQAQAEAYFALLAPLLDEPWFAGFFMWRFVSDFADVTQEAEWGFSPRGKQAELVLRDAFAAAWAADAPFPAGTPFARFAAERIGVY